MFTPVLVVLSSVRVVLVVVFVSVVNFRLSVLVLVLVSASVVGGVTTSVNDVVAVLLVLVVSNSVSQCVSVTQCWC